VKEATAKRRPVSRRRSTDDKQPAPGITGRFFICTMISGPLKLVCRSRSIDLSEPVVMGVLNVTPDSFSDGGRYVDADTAVARALEMVTQGAAIVDIGGESTRPGAAPVTANEQLRRVMPVIERLASRTTAAISIDTSDPVVMREATAAGAEIINDVRALRGDDRAMTAAAATGAAVVLMHMQGEPATMQLRPEYTDVVREVAEFLHERVSCCERAGIPRERLCVDPGIGFGKTAVQNLALLANLELMSCAGVPVLIGVSRKSLVGIISGQPADSRDAASSVLAALCVARGARIVRAHDVSATVDALKVAVALERAASAGE